MKHPSSPAEEQELIQQLRAALEGTDTDQLLVQGGEEGLTDMNLRRWLVARKWHVEQTARDLRAHAVWRKEFVPKGYIDELEIPTELGHKKVFLQGHDKLGCGFTILVIKNHDGLTHEENKKLFVYGMDAMIAAGDPQLNPQRKVSGIIDLDGFGLRNSDLHGLRNIFTMLQSHYVERLSVLYFYEAPLLFYGLWKIVEPFVDPVTKAKVHFVYKKGGEAAKAFDERFGKEVLPPEYGGTAAWVPIEKAVMEMRAAKQASKPEA